MSQKISIEELKESAEETSGIDIDDLIRRLNEIKSQEERRKGELTPAQKKLLYLKICDYSWKEIAFIYQYLQIPSPEEIEDQEEYLGNRSSNIKKDPGNNLNIYLKKLLKVSDDNKLLNAKGSKLVAKLREVCKLKEKMTVGLSVKIGNRESAKFIDVLLEEFPNIKKFAKL